MYYELIIINLQLVVWHKGQTQIRIYKSDFSLLLGL
jgi:hypothetical protein